MACLFIFLDEIVVQPVYFEALVAATAIGE